MLRTMKREMALSLGMAFPVETHLRNEEKRTCMWAHNVHEQTLCLLFQFNLPHTLHVSATLLITSVVSTLHSHVVVVVYLCIIDLKKRSNVSQPIGETSSWASRNPSKNETPKRQAAVLETLSTCSPPKWLLCIALYPQRSVIFHSFVSTDKHFKINPAMVHTHLTKPNKGKWRKCGCASIGARTCKSTSASKFC